MTRLLVRRASNLFLIAFSFLFSFVSKTVGRSRSICVMFSFAVMGGHIPDTLSRYPPCTGFIFLESLVHSRLLFVSTKHIVFYCIVVVV